MGHVLDNTLQDIFVRRARQEGKTFCGSQAPTMPALRLKLKSKNSCWRRQDKANTIWAAKLSLKKVWDFKQASGGVILQQLQKLGASCDWDRASFTLDEDYSKGVLTAFVRFYQRGYIYRGKRMVNWCPATQTALSDEEVTMRAQSGILYKMRYELVEPDGKRTHLEISTTRPETLMGDSAVAVHPDDERYQHLIGKPYGAPSPVSKSRSLAMHMLIVNLGLAA